MTVLGYGNAVFAPKIYSPGIKVYIAAHNIILAHAKAYRVYDKAQNGKYCKFILHCLYIFFAFSVYCIHHLTYESIHHLRVTNHKNKITYK